MAAKCGGAGRELGDLGRGHEAKEAGNAQTGSEIGLGLFFVCLSFEVQVIQTDVQPGNSSSFIPYERKVPK